MDVVNVSEVSGRVSFIVPTLNRGNYVERAVASCLENNYRDIEVVVIDSSSDDGSFENLVVKHGNDSRVRLLQNPKGSGPTKSWIEGVETASGEFMTFVWSDDIVSPNFLAILLPPLLSGAVIAAGEGRLCNIENSISFSNDTTPAENIEAKQFLDHYSDVSTTATGNLVSPVCSLFRASVFRNWAEEIRTYCQSDPLREQIMWRSAIGPDLMLYLAALEPDRGPAALTDTVVAQFSAHSDSITIRTGFWKLKTGYWLARLWYLQNITGKDPDLIFRKFWAFSFVMGVGLTLLTPFEKEFRQFTVVMARETWLLLRIAYRYGILFRGLVQALTLILPMIRRVSHSRSVQG